MIKSNGERKAIRQKFYVLNSKAAKNVILGVDYMEKLGKLTFDFENGQVFVQNRRIKTVEKRKAAGRISEKITLPARSETIVAVSSMNQVSLLTADFIPSRVLKGQGVYSAHCRVTPDIKGNFVVKVLNTNSQDVVLQKRQVCGHLKPT